MKNNIRKEIQERREHAERIVSMLSASVKSERDNRML